MNVSELARKLKINPQELRDILPQFGINIGQKAIKIDNYTAQKIIREWPQYLRRLQAQKSLELKQDAGAEAEDLPKKVIKIPRFLTVRELADIADIPVNKILTELMSCGIFISMNEKMDYDTAAVIGSDLGLEVQAIEEGEDKNEAEKNKLNEILKKEKKETLSIRPPVIVVMGHVDHGKTKLLDAIRRTDIVATEAGGITQHIGAYQVERKKRLITCIDTPGHEAFTAMRSRGAKVADVAILVVAADDGVKPQTVEAFRIIEAAKIPYIVAINKIDKDEADINKTKQELASKLNITPEDWGGKTICVPVSAKDNKGISELLDLILLSADMNEETIIANSQASAAGTIIESRLDKGAGPIATILIQNGTLRVGDQLTFDGLVYGKVKTIKNHLGENIKEAGPSMPARILGLKITPEVGDILEVGEGVKIKNKQTKQNNKQASSIIKQSDESRIKLFRIVIKSDVLGSSEAIEESLEKINTQKVKVKIIHKALGNITEGDIQKAESSQAVIFGFNVKLSPQAEELAREKNIEIKLFNIIYDLLKYAKSKMEDLLEPEFQRIDLGSLKVKAIFRNEHNSQIIGGRVLEGKIESDCLIEVWEGQEDFPRAIGKLIQLQSGKQTVSKVEAGEECGLCYEGKPLIQENSMLKFFRKEKIENKL